MFYNLRGVVSGLLLSAKVVVKLDFSSIAFSALTKLFQRDLASEAYKNKARIRLLG